jgi:uncharacterized protein (TIGR03435 family)
MHGQVRFMAGMETGDLSRCGMLMLAVAARTAVAVFAGGQAGALQVQSTAQTAVAQTKLPAFGVASVKRNMSAASTSKLEFASNGVNIENVSLMSIIRAAYGMFNTLDDKFIGIPGWASTENFDIEAKVDDADVAEFQELSFDKRQLMVQALLADRFKLRAHHETRELPIYELVVTKSGPGPMLQASKPGANSDSDGIKVGRGQITGQNVVPSQLVTALTRTLGRTVVEKTEQRLQGKYDFTLSWTPDEAEPSLSQSPSMAAQGPDASGLSIFTAIQEQLGLRLVQSRGPVEVLVIDHVEYPSAN